MPPSQMTDVTNPPGAMLPLPEPDHEFVDMEDEDPDILVWRAEKMHAYAKAYAAPLIARVAELQAERDRLNAIVNTPQADDFLRRNRHQGEHMSDQSEALRLADELDTTGRPGGLCGASATVLRRQHSRIEADEALMRAAVEALDACRDWPGAHQECYAAITALRKRLESSK